MTVAASQRQLLRFLDNVTGLSSGQRLELVSEFRKPFVRFVISHVRVCQMLTHQFEFLLKFIEITRKPCQTAQDHLCL